MCQQAVERKGLDKQDLSRTGRMALYGGGMILLFDQVPHFLSAGLQNPLLTSRLTAVFGPGATLWYKFLQRRIALKSENATIAARVLVDQSVFASTNLFLFLSSMAYMEGTDPKEKLNSTYWNALQKNWMVWPAVQAINFKLVPLEHRVLVVNIVSLGECSPT